MDNTSFLWHLLTWGRSSSPSAADSDRSERLSPKYHVPRQQQRSFTGLYDTHVSIPVRSHARRLALADTLLSGLLEPHLFLFVLGIYLVYNLAGFLKKKIGIPRPWRPMHLRKYKELCSVSAVDWDDEATVRRLEEEERIYLMENAHLANKKRGNGMPSGHSAVGGFFWAHWSCRLLLEPLLLPDLASALFGVPHSVWGVWLLPTILSRVAMVLLVGLAIWPALQYRVRLRKHTLGQVVAGVSLGVLCGAAWWAGLALAQSAWVHPSVSGGLHNLLEMDLLHVLVGSR